MMRQSNRPWFEAHMANGIFNRYAARGGVVDRVQYDEGLRAHMLRVYNYMMTGLAVTGLVAFLTASLAMTNRDVAVLLYGSPLRWLVMLAPIGFVFFLSYRINQIEAGTARTLFWVY